MRTIEPDCISCGACCFGGHDRYIVLLPGDRERGIPDHALTEQDGRHYMRMAEGHCAQLTRTDEGKLVCGIYDIRPTACRAFRAGSFECGMSRKHRGPEAARLRERVEAPAAALPPMPDLVMPPPGAGQPDGPDLQS